MALLIASSAISQAAMMVASTASTLLLARAAGEGSAGLPAALGVAGNAAGSLLLTRVMQARGRRSGLTYAYATTTLGALVALIGVTQWIPLVLLGMFVLGVGNAGAQLSRYAGAELVSSSRRGLALGAVVSAGAVGAIGGPVLLAPTAEVARQTGLPALAGAFIAAAFGGVVATTAVASGGALGDIGAAPRRSDPVRLASIPGLRAAVTGMVAAQAAMVALMIAAPVDMDDRGHAMGAIGVVISIHVFGMYGLASLTGFLADRIPAVRLLAGGLLILATSAAALMQSSHLTLPWFAVALFSLGYGWNVTVVAASTHIVRVVPQTIQMQVQGSVECLAWATSSVAALACTPVFALGGYQLLGLACLLLVAITAAMRGKPHTRHEIKESCDA
ncbi:MAG: hypothetical protein QM747_17850 [Nocardioides sp.]